MYKILWTEEMDTLLGTDFDWAVAEQASRADLWIRQRFGIESSLEIVDRIVAYLMEVQQRRESNA